MTPHHPTHQSTAAHLSINWVDRPPDLQVLSTEWNELAKSSRSPFLTSDWLQSWWQVGGPRSSVHRL